MHRGCVNYFEIKYQLSGSSVRNYQKTTFRWFLVFNKRISRPVDFEMEMATSRTACGAHEAY